LLQTLPKDAGQLSSNAAFRSIVPDKAIVDYIERLQLGKRRGLKVSKKARREVNAAKASGDFAKQIKATASTADKFFLLNKMKFIGAATSEEEFVTSSLPGVAFVGPSFSDLLLSLFTTLLIPLI